MNGFDTLATKTIKLVLDVAQFTWLSTKLVALVDHWHSKSVLNLVKIVLLVNTLTRTRLATIGVPFIPEIALQPTISHARTIFNFSENQPFNNSQTLLIFIFYICCKCLRGIQPGKHIWARSEYRTHMCHHLDTRGWWGIASAVATVVPTLSRQFYKRGYSCC